LKRRSRSTICWRSVQITKFFFNKDSNTYSWIAHIYLSSNAVMINKDSDTYPRRPIAGIMPPHRRWWWSRCSWPEGHEELNATVPRHHDASVTALAHRHSATRVVPHSTRTRIAHHNSFRIQSSRAVEEEVFGLENLAAWRRSVWGESSNSLARLQTRELSQREERKRGGAYGRGEESSSSNSLNPLVSNSPLWGVYIGGWGGLILPPRNPKGRRLGWEGAALGMLSYPPNPRDGRLGPWPFGPCAWTP
jgi:hypothetical protein